MSIPNGMTDSLIIKAAGNECFYRNESVSSKERKGEKKLNEQFKCDAGKMTLCFGGC